MTTTEIDVHYIDDNNPGEAEILFGRESVNGNVALSCEIDGVAYTLNIHPEKYPDEIIEKLSLGQISPRHSAVLLDIDFSNLDRNMLTEVDWDEFDDSTNKCNWGIPTLRTIKRADPDIPTIVFTTSPNQDISFVSGQLSADDFIAKPSSFSENFVKEFSVRVVKAIKSCEERSIYDHDHLEIADGFAADYDDEEQSRCATVAYYHYENEQITAILDQIVKTIKPGERIRILDLGCGTGRIEKRLASLQYSNRLDVVAVDFSGKMVLQCQNELQNLQDVHVGLSKQEYQDDQMTVSLFRAPAESLTFLKSLYSGGFDLAVLGFGFLSYVRYSSVLTPHIPDSNKWGGIADVLNDQGKLLFSVYNENSYAYNAVRDPNFHDEKLSIAAMMDLNSGFLRVGKRYIACEAFSIPQIMRLIRRAGFSLNPENDISTLPTLYLACDNEAATKVAQPGGDPIAAGIVGDSWKQDQDFPKGIFNRDLYLADKQYSGIDKEHGHYIVGIARKLSA